jgi:hypothetical protein
MGMVTMTLKEQLTEATRTIDALREQLGHEHTLSVELEALLNGKDAFISEQADRLAFHVRESARLQEQFLAHIARDEDTIRYWTAEWERQRDQIAELTNDLTESAAQNTAQNHRIAELTVEAENAISFLKAVEWMDNTSETDASNLIEAFRAALRSSSETKESSR